MQHKVTNQLNQAFHVIGRLMEGRIDLSGFFVCVLRYIAQMNVQLNKQETGGGNV